MNVSEKIRRLTIISMLCTLAFVAVVAVRIPLVPAASFLEYEPKDIIILTGGFIFGPMTAVLISMIASFIELVTISSSGMIGFIMNVLSTVSFVCPAAYIYKKRHTMASALVGMVIGAFLMTAVMVLWNYLITPIYMGYPREAVVELLLPAIVPFNLIKCGINTVITFLLYQPLIHTLKKANLMPFPLEDTKDTKKIGLGTILIVGMILVTILMVILARNGII